MEKANFNYAADTSEMVLVLRGGEQSVEVKQRREKIAHIVSLVFTKEIISKIINSIL